MIKVKNLKIEKVIRIIQVSPESRELSPAGEKMRYKNK